MGWVYAVLALMAYVLVGLIAAYPLIRLFALSTDDGLGVVLIWTWPVWVAALVLVAWSILGLTTHWETPWGRFALMRKARHEQREQALADQARREQASREAEAKRIAEDGARKAAFRDWRKAAERAATQGPRNGVPARIPRDADDFESVCAEWLQRCGVKASRTAKGPDGGLDVIGPTYAAQCKFHPSNKVGAPEIQQLKGAAAQAGKKEMGFFHYGPGYTDAAITAAKKLGIALWAFDTDKVQFRRV